MFRRKEAFIESIIGHLDSISKDMNMNSVELNKVELNAYLERTVQFNLNFMPMFRSGSVLIIMDLDDDYPAKKVAQLLWSKPEIKGFYTILDEGVL